MTQRLLVCSNSAPAFVTHPALSLQQGAAGGLLPHLLALLASRGGTWFFPARAEEAPSWPEHVGDVTLQPILATGATLDHHYQTISIRTLLWLFHYLHDTSSAPAFDRGLHHAWSAYVRVNYLFAEGVAECMDQGSDSVILVNDYHLLLVPGALAQGQLSPGTQLVYVHYVPWCEPDYFGILPSAIRRQILTSLLSCDVIVFASQKWLDAFARCCAAYLLDAEVSDGRVIYRGTATRLRAVPLPLDTANVMDMLDAEATQRWRDFFRKQAHGRRLLVRVDRLDLWKNHIRGFAAFEELLSRHPTLVNELWFVAVVARPRYRSARHQAYEEACRAVAARINQQSHQKRLPESITILYPQLPAESRHRAVAALEQADTVLINPISDGFNLVAKEAVLLGESASVLLSTTAGAYEVLAPAVTPLDPFDVSHTVDALEEALGGYANQNQARFGLRQRILQDNTYDWLASTLAE